MRHNKLVVVVVVYSEKCSLIFREKLNIKVSQDEQQEDVTSYQGLNRSLFDANVVLSANDYDDLCNESDSDSGTHFYCFILLFIQVQVHLFIWLEQACYNKVDRRVSTKRHISKLTNNFIPSTINHFGLL